MKLDVLSLPYKATGCLSGLSLYNSRTLEYKYMYLLAANVETLVKYTPVMILMFFLLVGSLYVLREGSVSIYGEGRRTLCI